MRQYPITFETEMMSAETEMVRQLFLVRQLFMDKKEASKADQVRILREARFERWRRVLEMREQADMMKRGLSDEVGSPLSKARGRPKQEGPWVAEGISRATWNRRNKGKPK
jgi:hypothetical protein